MKFKKDAVYRIIHWGNDKPRTWCFHNILIFTGKFLEDTYWGSSPKKLSLEDVKEYKLRKICDDITKMKEVNSENFNLYNKKDILWIPIGGWNERYLVRANAKKSMKLFKQMIKHRIGNYKSRMESFKDDLERLKQIKNRARDNDISVLNEYIPSNPYK